MEAQVRALSGINTEEAKAQRARLNAELQEKNEDLEDTVRDHIYELQVQGLDDLQQQLQEDLEKWQKELAQNLQMASDTITQAINNTGASVSQIAHAMNELLGQFDLRRSDISDVQYNVGTATRNTKGFVKGTRKVGKNMTAFTMEDGREMIFTNHGILT